jgi:DegV family protein with EDD domain
MAIRIVTDSASDLPTDLAERHGITVIPAYVIVGDETFRDGIDITADDFYRQLGTLPRLPTTAQPTPADFEQAYRGLLARGDQIVSIHVGGKLSGTVNSANQARLALGDDGAQVEIIDSNIASLPLTLALVEAAQAAEGSGDHRAVAQQVRDSLHRYHAFFMLDTLEYLQKGGRIGKAQAFVGSMLSVKPILRILDGEVHPLERPRNRQRATRRLVEMTREMVPVRQLGVIYSTDPDPAQAVLEELSGLVPAESVVQARFGPVLGTYLGPNAVGVAVTTAN